MERMEWQKLAETYAGYKANKTPGLTEKHWREDVIALLVAICEEVWLMRKNQP